MANDKDTIARQLALAAIAIDAPADAIGEKPDMEELWDWIGGHVESQRATQIQSHVARDPELYTQWRELRVALDEVSQDVVASSHAVALESEPPSANSEARPVKEAGGSIVDRLLGWLSPAPLGGAFATAAILGVAISVGLNQNRQQQEFWADWQSPKSLSQTVVAEEDVALARSFLIGMGEQMQALSIPALGPTGQELLSDAKACADDNEACQQRRSVMRELGQISVLTKVGCVSGHDVSSDHQPRIGSILGLVEQDEQLRRFLAPVRQWASAEDAKTRCRAVSNLIQRGLTSAADRNL